MVGVPGVDLGALWLYVVEVRKHDDMTRPKKSKSCKWKMLARRLLFPEICTMDYGIQV